MTGFPKSAMRYFRAPLPPNTLSRWVEKLWERVSKNRGVEKLLHSCFGSGCDWLLPGENASEGVNIRLRIHLMTAITISAKKT